MRISLFYSKVLFSVLLAGCQTLSWAVDDKAVEETARRTSRSASDILFALERCDRDESTINACSEYHLVEADQLLNAAYTNLLTKMRGTTSYAPLVKAQMEWIRFRDLDCEYYASSLVGGTMHGQWVMNCQRERTVARTRQIESYLRCEANGCPGN